MNPAPLYTHDGEVVAHYCTACRRVVSCQSESGEVATYRYWDIGPQRLHHWMPSGKWAIGNGPIRDMSVKEVEEYLRKHWPAK